MKTVLRSKRILCLEGIRSGDIIINGEFIEDIAGYGSSKHAFDLKNLLVAPGIIDLHSDAIEKEIEPRPGAVFPEDMAVAELDKKLAAAGVTTIFHAVAVFENFEIYNRSMKTSERLIRLIHKVNKEHLSVDNRIHLRFETSSASVLPDIQKLIEENLVDMVSIMDHTPGQRQWKDIHKWNKFLHANMSDEEVKEFIDKKNMMKDKDKLLEFMKYVRKRNITTLSHDDDLNEHIDENVELGVMISEFPLTVAVAHYAKSKGISVGMGAPNVLRGGSQSGNVSAMDLVREGVCDYLCSDYHPSSMLKSVFRIADEKIMSFEKAYEMISAIPAKISGLTERGSIEKGKRADIIAIDESFSPKNVLTIKSGECVYCGIKGIELHNKEAE